MRPFRLGARERPSREHCSFSRKAAKIAKTYIPQRSLRALRAFARASLLAGYFFLAKPQRSQRPIYPAEPSRPPRLCERIITTCENLARQAAKIAKTCIPLRSLCVLRAFAREKKHHASDIISLRESFLAKPPRSLSPIYPCGAFALSAPLREPHYSRDTFFLAKPLRSQRPAYPCGAFAPSAPLREPHYSRDTFFLAKPLRSQRPAYPAKPPRLCESLINRGIFFSRQAAKIAKPCVPQRSLCVLRAFARE